MFNYFLFFFLYSNPGADGENVKLVLTKLPRIFVHVVRHFNSNCLRYPAVAGVHFGSRDNYSAMNDGTE